MAQKANGTIEGRIVTLDGNKKSGVPAISARYSLLMKKIRFYSIETMDRDGS